MCSISQSTDWFQSISRTLKWNERERQKSFVVVEESPTKKAHRRRSSDESTSAAEEDAEKAEDAIPDEEEDEVTEGEEDEEDEKFDIDDLSSTESSSKDSTNKSSPSATQQETLSGLPVSVSHEKALEADADARREHDHLRAAARALAAGSPALRKHRRSRSRSGVRSGVETPDRFGGPHPQPPKLSPRHVQWAGHDGSQSSSSASLATAPGDRDAAVRGERGARDDIHSPRDHYGARSRIPRDRNIETDTLRTPTASEGPRRRRSRERTTQEGGVDGDNHPRRAFAVWGHDESDSAASDSDY